MTPDDDVVVIENSGVHHRVAAYPQHEDRIAADEFGGERIDLLDVLLGQDRRSGSDAANQRNVPDRSTVQAALRSPVVNHLDGPGLGWIAS